MPSRCLFALLESLDHEIEDQLDIMSLVNGEKPIRPYVCFLNFIYIRFVPFFFEVFSFLLMDEALIIITSNRMISSAIKQKNNSSKRKA